MTTAQDQQSRTAYEDGKWYWVEREGWHGEPPTIAPACYKAECDAWYSYIFSGISTPYLKVLEPCELQAARALPAGDDALLPIAAKSHGAWDGLEELLDLPDGTEVYTAAQVQAMGRVPMEDEKLRKIIEAFSCGEGKGHDVHGIARAIEAAHGITHPTGD